MIKRAWLILFLLAFLFTDIAPAQQTVRVVILPFTINAQEDLSYLQKEIPQAIKNQLEQEGAKVLVIDRATLDSRNMQVGNMKDVLAIGLETGTDYIVWGSLTWIGQNFSMDAKLLAPAETEKPQNFSVEGEGVENLIGTLTNLVSELGLKLFKREKIIEVRIKGNNRIEEDAIRRVLKVKTGDVLNPKDISDEIKAVYKMGYFDDIRVETQSGPQGNIITFIITEKPTVRSILLDGNTWVFDDEEIKEELTLRKGSILNINIIQNDMRRIEELYKEKNFYNVKVKFNIFPRKGMIA